MAIPASSWRPIHESLVSGDFSGDRASTSCRSCGTWSAGRCPWSDHGRRSLRGRGLPADHWFTRFEVKPGLTGLWQVSGRCELTLDEMIALDIDYVQRRSFWLNLRILLRTLRRYSPAVAPPGSDPFFCSVSQRLRVPWPDRDRTVPVAAWLTKPGGELPTPEQGEPAGADHCGRRAVNGSEASCSESARPMSRFRPHQEQRGRLGYVRPSQWTGPTGVRGPGRRAPPSCALSDPREPSRYGDV